MKKNGRLFLMAIILIGLFISVNKKEEPHLTYNYKESSLIDFKVENDYVVFHNYISLKNNTDKDVYFYLSADYTEERGLVRENIAYAYKNGTPKKQRFYLKANTEDIFDVSFTAKKGDKKQKKDRLPPKNVYFEIS